MSWPCLRCACRRRLCRYASVWWSSNKLLSRLPAVASAMPTAVVLSDDGQANDVTRTPVAIEVALAEGEGAGTLSLTRQHFKSGFDADDVFRRTVDVARTGQASALPSADVALIAETQPAR